MSYKRKSDSYLNDTRGPAKKARTEAEDHVDLIPRLPLIKDPKLEKAVFTHPTYGGMEKEEFVTYDRLEFVGDAEIERMATRLIIETFKSLPAGKMSQLRELLVKNDTLSQYTIMYGFDKRLRRNLPENFGKNQKESQNLKMYGDVFEAYIAAIILSDPINGYFEAEEWLHELWTDKLKDSAVADLVKPNNAGNKQILATKIQAKGTKIDYRDEKPRIMHKGKGLETYFIGVFYTGFGWKDQHLGSGVGVSKGAAGDRAAAAALENPLMLEINKAKTAEKEKEKAR